MNVRNIASRNTAQPLYAIDVEYEGFHIAVQGHDLQAVKQELWDEIEKIDIITLSQCEAA